MFQNVKVKQREGCIVYLQQGRVLCRVEAGGGAAPQTVPLFPVAAAARLLMDKSSATRVRVVLEEQNQPFLDLTFSKEGDREAFALQLKQQKVAVKTEAGGATPSPTTTVVSNPSDKAAPAETVKSEANPLTGHLDGLFSGSDRRGVLGLFAVLDDLVDVGAMSAGSSSDAPVLKPLTDQLIADVFAAVPTLAAAHEIMVTKRGLSEKAFWVSVVSKYLCFKATPLDGLVGIAAGTSATGGVAIGGAGNDTAEAYMRYVNMSSARPLRHAKGVRRGREEEQGREDAAVGRLSEAESFTLQLACCAQPRELPATFHTNPIMALPPAVDEYGTSYLLSDETKLNAFVAASVANLPNSAATACSPAAKESWARFWHAVDQGQLAEAAALLEKARAVDSGRPFIGRRAEQVLSDLVKEQS